MSLAGPAHAATVITTGTGTTGADAYIQLGTPTANYGSSASLTVKYTGSDTNGVTRKAYLRFDLSGLGADVSTATLSLTVGLNNGGSTNSNPQNFTVAVYGLNDGSTAGGGMLGEDWDESAINWNNAPANIVSGAGAGDAVQTGGGTGNGGQATLLGSFNVTTADVADSVVVAASGSALVDFLNADTNGYATFIITRTGWSSGGGTPAPTQSSSNLTFRSKEYGSDEPALMLELVPEPDTALLVALGALALGCRRRRVA